MRIYRKQWDKKKNLNQTSKAQQQQHHCSFFSHFNCLLLTSWIYRIKFSSSSNGNSSRSRKKKKKGKCICVYILAIRLHAFLLKKTPNGLCFNAYQHLCKFWLSLVLPSLCLSPKKTRKQALKKSKRKRK